MVLPEVSINQELLRTQHARTLQEQKGLRFRDGTNRLGAVLRERRTHLGLTLSRSPSRVGAKSYLSEIETGVRATAGARSGASNRSSGSRPGAHRDRQLGSHARVGQTP